MARDRPTLHGIDELETFTACERFHPQVNFAKLPSAPGLLLVPVVTLGGLSKNYLAPGWRIGWSIVSGEGAAVKPFVEAMHKLLRARLSAAGLQQAERFSAEMREPESQAC